MHPRLVRNLATGCAAAPDSLSRTASLLSTEMGILRRGSSDAITEICHGSNHGAGSFSGTMPPGRILGHPRHGPCTVSGLSLQPQSARDRGPTAGHARCEASDALSG